MRAKVAHAGKHYEVRFHPEVAKFMSNGDSNRIREIERAHRFRIHLVGDENLKLDEYKIIDTTEDVDITALYQGVR
jgi:Ribonuclease G/E